ncbi:T9SS type A sorting domain-containing protein [bacterium]|nr:T9SS type A sorting domain-containing protein [bacterium]
MTRPILGSVAGLLTLLLSQTASSQVSFEMILAGGYATTVSDDGTAVAGNLVGNYETFRWTEGGGVVALGQSSVDVLGVGGGTPGISADGTRVSAAILGADSTYMTQGIWTEGSGWAETMPPPPADGGIIDWSYGSAWGISGNGEEAVGLYWRPGQPDGSAHASIGNPTDGVTDLGSSGGSSRANKANYDGSVVVGWDSHPSFGHRRPAVWVNGALTVLSDPELLGEVHAVNADGTIIGGSYKDAWGRPREAWVWRWSGAAWEGTSYGSIPPTSGDSGLCRVLGLSDDGSVLVGYDSFFGDPFYSTGFLWTEDTGLVDIAVYLEDHGVAPQGFDIKSLSDVTPDGTTLIGYGQDAASPFTVRSFRIRLDPAVGTPVVAAAASPGLRAGPNPFRTGTTMSFDVARPATGILAVHDASGRLVRTLVDGSLPAGTHHVRWDGRDRTGRRAATGVYYVRLQADAVRATEKVVLLR